MKQSQLLKYLKILKLNFNMNSSGVVSTYKEESFTTFSGIVSGNSVIGEGHKAQQLPNQDAFSIGIKEGKVWAAIADGLGSCPKSHVGAQYAVECFQKWIEEELDKYPIISEELLTVLDRKLIDRWNAKFSDMNASLYDTTLLYAFYKEGYLAMGYIGDGIILYAYDETYHELASVCDTFSNFTDSMGSSEAKEKIHHQLVDLRSLVGEITIILATDGISNDLATTTKNELLIYLKDQMNQNGVESVHLEIQHWIQNWKTEGHMDDRTFCIIHIYKQE